MRKHVFSTVFIAIIFFFPLLSSAQRILLVKYGSSAATNSFGLTGWTTVLKSNNLSYTSMGNGGLIVNSEIGEYDDYRGIRGTPRKFSVGEQIVVTWYNHSDEVFFFTARISFTDDDEPDVVTPDGNWYTMRSFSDYRYTYSEIQPHSYAKTVFNITDTGVHSTDATYSLVNINISVEWSSTYQKQFLVCDKIELFSDADTLAPEAPTGLAANAVSDSKIQLSWNPASDNVAVVEYLIYMNGAVEGYSRSNEYTCVFLEPARQYSFSVTALDATGNESVPSKTATATTQPYQGAGSLISPSGFEYLGAFALPEDFSWGGDAIAYYRDGDGGQSGATDGFPGSLFISNLNQPENGLVGEVNIPIPNISPQKNVEQLNQSAILTQPVNIRPSNVNNWDFVDVWRSALEYVPEESRLYSAWSYYYTVTGEKHVCISCCDAANLSGSTKYGAWYVGNAAQPPIDAMISDWLFSAPQSWADANSSGRNLITGRYREGGLSGLGPTMYAFSRVGSTPPAANSALPITTLLEYGSVEGVDDYTFPNAIDGYKHSDDWREALWLTAEQQQAVVIIGNKALGHNWYGYHGEQMRHDWVIADVPYPDFWETDPDGKGWRAHVKQPMIIFYNPDDLAKVAKGQMNSYEPQPYAALRFSRDIFFGKDQEIVSATCDPQNRLLYVTEFVRELEGRLIIHAWRFNPVTVSVDFEEQVPLEFRLNQNYPNPFNPKTTIRYQLPVVSQVQLKIYNLRGQEIKTLVDEFQAPGIKSVSWDGFDAQGKRAASGIYVYRLRAGQFSMSKTMLFIQ
ncbi:MAG: T9SS type A sorting domain-containing protein [candidate division KSB1 bacterium]|nr:T9SS type A sorting domain-containing protein [candidate division KSB1 bacterium]